MPGPAPPDPAEVYSMIARWLQYVEPGEQFERVQLSGRLKSGRVVLHTVPMVHRDPDGLTEFQRRALEVAAKSPVPLKRAELVRRATGGRGKATGRYGQEIAELVSLDKLKVCHRVYVTDVEAKCPTDRN